MAIQNIPLPAEFEEFAAALVKSGRYPNSTEVLHAAMNALHRETTEAHENAILETLAEEAEASGLVDFDIFERVRAELGLKSRNAA